MSARATITEPSARYDRSDAGHARHGASIRDRWVYRAIAALTIAPIWISAIRSGLQGWIPTNDAAAAVLRAKHSLGAHPTLVGLYAWPSSHVIDVTTYTAGPWQLWWMSVPVKVLGASWGPLLSMALLNSLFLVLAAWCVRRRLGDRSAMLALVLLALLLWSFGANAFHSPVPVVAVAAPFAAFCFAAWALAAGDEGVLGVFAGLASYLVLCHPSTTLLVPAIGVSALVIGIVALWKDRRRDPEGWPTRRRRSWRSVLIALGVTVVLWIPSLIQEFTTSPGNLTHLYRASSQLPSWMSLRRSIASTFALFTGTPFWFRGSTDHSFLTSTAGIPSLAATVLTAVALGVIIVVLGLVTYRRGDRLGLSAVVLGACSLASMWLHFMRSPKGQYFLPVWVVAMFLTYLICYAAVRSLPDRMKHVGPQAAVAAVLVLAVANLPARRIPHFTASTPSERSISKALDRQIIPHLRNRGAVTLAPAFYGTYKYAAALVVALDEAGIPVCAHAIVSFQGYPNAACDKPRPGVTVIYRSAATYTVPPPGETVIARHVTLDASEQRAWQESSLDVQASIRAVVDAGDTLRPTVAYDQRVKAGKATNLLGPDGPDFFADPGKINTDFGTQGLFARLVVATDAHSDGRVTLVKLPGVPDDELLRWARLQRKLAQGIVVTMKPQA